MKFIEEYRDRGLVSDLIERIKKISRQEVSFMEVCGGHTMAIQKFGIPSLLPSHITLKSGPGCPVCVSSRSYIDRAIAISRLPDTILTTFGDLVRVPGSYSTLEKERAAGARIKIVYSILEAIKIAEKNPDQKVVFLGIGFETTAPSSAAGIKMAVQKELKNFFLYSGHKIMPPAMAALIEEGVKLNGYIGPGHVSAITGTSIYKEIPEKYGLGVVISGFEPVDMLQSILLLVQQVENRSPRVEIQYKRVVPEEGNPKALELMKEVFELRDDWWRGLGVLSNSGLKLQDKYRELDAEYVFDVSVEDPVEDKRCICGEILKGIKNPNDCRLFGKICNPENPVGACMVSHEGACQAHYRYNYHE